MTTRDEKRKAAVQAHEDQADAERRHKAEAAAVLEQHQQKMRADRDIWANKALLTIRTGVQAASEAFARHGSRYLVGRGDDTSPDSIAYRIVPGGRPTHTEASFTFIFRDGYVHPETTARGCDKFPGLVPVGDVTQDWVEDVADSVMTAVLGGQRMRIEE